MEELDKSLKPERTIELNETTDGFITQINDETTHSQQSNNDSSNNNININNNNKGYILMDPSVLIPNENKRSKGKHSLHYSRSFVSMDTQSIDNKQKDPLMLLSSSSPQPPPIVVPSNLNTNSFVNPEHTISFVANSDIKEFVKKTGINTAIAAAKMQSFSMNGTLKQPNISRSNIENKSNFSRAFQFLPNILSDSNSFPNRKNFHHRRIFLRYLTTKLEKENEFANEVKSNLTSQNNLNSNTQILSSSKKSTGKSRRNFLIEDSSAYYEDQQIFVDLKKASSPPPSQLERYANKLKQQASNLTQQNLKSKSLITNNSNNNNNQDKKSTQIDDETKSMYTKPITINSVKNVVDLNEISESSRLSGHYFSGVRIQNNNKKLADLNLNELWPSSRMYKVSIKGNSWVNSFKARTFANEVNTNFRNTLESGYSSSRLDSKRNITLLPNIKQIF